MKVSKNFKAVSVLMFVVSALVSGCGSDNNESKPSGGSASNAASAVADGCGEANANQMSAWVETYNVSRTAAEAPANEGDFDNLMSDVAARLGQSFFDNGGLEDAAMDACCTDSRFSTSSFCSDKQAVAATVAANSMLPSPQDVVVAPEDTSTQTQEPAQDQTQGTEPAPSTSQQ